MTALDDICWLLNIRGDDVQFNPVVYGYVLVTMDAVHLFIHEGREVRAAGVALQLHPYAEFLPFLETVAARRFREAVLRRERRELRREAGARAAEARRRLRVGLVRGPDA